MQFFPSYFCDHEIESQFKWPVNPVTLLLLVLLLKLSPCTFLRDTFEPHNQEGGDRYVNVEVSFTVSCYIQFPGMNLKRSCQTRENALRFQRTTFVN